MVSSRLLFLRLGGSRLDGGKLDFGRLCHAGASLLHPFCRMPHKASGSYLVLVLLAPVEIVVNHAKFLLGIDRDLDRMVGEVGIRYLDLVFAFRQCQTLERR